MDDYRIYEVEKSGAHPVVKWMSIQLREIFDNGLVENIPEPSWDARTVYAATDTGQILAGIQFNLVDWDRTVAVLWGVTGKEHRGKGIHKALSTYLEDKYREQGYHRVTRSTNVKNTTTQEVFKREGYSMITMKYEKILISPDRPWDMNHLGEKRETNG